MQGRMAGQAMATQENEMDHEKHSPTRRAVIGDIAIGLAGATLAAGTEPALAQT
jgi:hypothetical protein